MSPLQSTEAIVTNSHLSTTVITVGTECLHPVEWKVVNMHNKVAIYSATLL